MSDLTLESLPKELLIKMLIDSRTQNQALCLKIAQDGIELELLRTELSEQQADDWGEYARA